VDSTERLLFRHWVPLGFQDIRSCGDCQVQTIFGESVMFSSHEASLVGLPEASDGDGRQQYLEVEIGAKVVQ
jgi:hypothetical protein